MIDGIETYNNRPTRAEISFVNLRNNLSIVKSLIDKKIKIMAVVKANAYGHGLYEISNELLKQGVDYLGVAVLEEGMYLRQRGITAPILVLGPIHVDQIAEFIAHDIEITSSSIDKSVSIAAVAKEMRKSGISAFKNRYWYGANRCALVSCGAIHRKIVRIRLYSNKRNIFTSGKSRIRH